MTGSDQTHPGPAPAGTDGIDRTDGAERAGKQGRPRQARGTLTRRAILLAAAEQFARFGFDGTSLDAVLTVAGVTKGALYFHFAAKRALAEAVITQMVTGWESVTVHVAALGVDPLRSVLATTDQIVAVMDEDPIARGGARLLRAGLDPARLARSAQAQLAGHILMAEPVPHGTDLWDRVTDMWQVNLPGIATSDWLAGWVGSDWAQRPRPQPVTLG
jgi:AcrR family transcriptional regulator